VEPTIRQSPVSETLVAVRENPLDTLGWNDVAPVLRRLLPERSEVPPVDVAAFGSHIA
jgi:hypothetical protein